MIICGIDEAGRGPLAGPVCAAAVILGGNFPLDILNDSKKLNVFHRIKARRIILEKALCYGIGWASHVEIDSINILQASLLAMKRAFIDMVRRETERQSIPSGENISVIIDGKFIPGIINDSCYLQKIKIMECKAVVKADAQVPQVMAASILAKTERDSLMDEMALLYPQYGYDKHKGYPTKAHREAVLKLGPSPIQRLSFKVKSCYNPAF